MKIMIDIRDKVLDDLRNNRNSCSTSMLLKDSVFNGIMISDNASRAEVFEMIFGMKIDTSADCGFFDCSDKLCTDCSFLKSIDFKRPTDHHEAYEQWWNAPYKE